VSGGLLLLMVAFVVAEAVPVVRQYGLVVFFTDEGWYPAAGQFNLAPMITGTLWAGFGALLAAVPLGLASAVFCRFYAPGTVAAVYERVLEVLGGIPSVVFGFWGLVVLVPLINQWQPPGASLLAGVLVLTLMILPTVSLTALAALDALPPGYRLNAAALGLSRWTTVWRVMLPAARVGILGGVLLALARALGETMAVLMVTGNVVRHAQSLFDPVRTLTANIALEMAYALGSHRSALFVSGLLLLIVVAVLLWLAETCTGSPAGDR